MPLWVLHRCQQRPTAVGVYITGVRMLRGVRMAEGYIMIWTYWMSRPRRCCQSKLADPFIYICLQWRSIFLATINTHVDRNRCSSRLMSPSNDTNEMICVISRFPNTHLHRLRGGQFCFYCLCMPVSGCDRQWHASLSGDMDISACHSDCLASFFFKKCHDSITAQNT